MESLNSQLERQLQQKTELSDQLTDIRAQLENYMPIAEHENLMNDEIERSEKEVKLLK